MSPVSHQLEERPGSTLYGVAEGGRAQFVGLMYSPFYQLMDKRISVFQVTSQLPVHHVDGSVE